MTQYLDYNGLVSYDNKIKRHIKIEDDKHVEVDSVITTEDIDKIINENN